MRHRILLLFAFNLVFIGSIMAQNTVTSGNWSDPSVWSTGTVPATLGTGTVNNPLTIEQKISVTLVIDIISKAIS